MNKFTLFLTAGLLVHTSGQAQVNVPATATPIVHALAADGYTSGTVIVAAMPNCQRDLKDPSCEGTQYPPQRRVDAAAMATAMAEVLGI